MVLYVSSLDGYHSRPTRVLGFSSEESLPLIATVQHYFFKRHEECLGPALPQGVPMSLKISRDNL